jgi:Leucine-rich repeat (LRR) protein
MFFSTIKVTHGKLVNLQGMEQIHSPELDYMNFTHNEISDTHLRLQHLPKLHTIDLSHNNLSFTQLYCERTNLKYIYLAHNSLSDVSIMGTFQGLYLFLEHNQLSELSFLASLNGYLSFINLQSNRLTSIDSLRVTPLPHPINLDLRSNPLECTCQAAKDFAWAVRHRHVINKEKCLGGINLYCTDPSLLDSQVKITPTPLTTEEPSTVRTTAEEKDSIWDIFDF